MLSLDRRIRRPCTSTEEKDSAAMASLLMDDSIMLLLLFLIDMSVLMMMNTVEDYKCRHRMGELAKRVVRSWQLHIDQSSLTLLLFPDRTVCVFEVKDLL